MEDSLKGDSSIKNVKHEQCTHLKTKTFTNSDIVEDFTFNNEQYAHAKLINKLFGSRKFVKTFWKLIVTSLFWGFIIGLVPILFNTMLNGFYDGSTNGNDMYMSVLYTVMTIGPINSLIISFLFAAFLC